MGNIINTIGLLEYWSLGNRNPFEELVVMRRVLLPLALLGAVSAVEGDTTDGSCLEPWALENFQPQSVTVGEVVESSAYHARTTVIMFLASW